jgi:hypothetical protein
LKLTSQLTVLGSLVIASAVLCAAPGQKGESLRSPQASLSGSVDGDTDPAEVNVVAPKTRISRPPKELILGKVVLWRNALKKRGITAFEEFDKLVVLETMDGQLLPIVPDWRGRAFFQDSRLRDRKVELIGYRRPRASTFQVLMIFTFDEKGIRQYTDYWCDICSIPMYEIKPCDCCQADIRIRYQPKGLPEYITQPTGSVDN